MQSSTPSSPFVDRPTRGSIAIERNAIDSQLVLEKELRNKVSTLEYKYKQLCDTTDIERLKHSERIALLEAELEKTSEALESAISDAKIIFDEDKKLKEQLKNASEVLTDANGKLEELQFKLENTTRKLAQAEVKIDYMQTNFDETRKKLEAQHQLALKKNNGLVESLRDSISEKDRKITQLTNMLGHKDDEINSLRSQNKATDEVKAREMYERECASQLEYIRELESKNLKISRKLSELQSKNDYVEILKDEKTTLLKKLESFENLEEQHGDLLLKYEKLQKTASLWKNENEGNLNLQTPNDILEENSKLELENKKLTKTLKSHRLELTKSQEDYVKLQSQLFKANTSISQLKQDISMRDVEILKLSNTIKLNNQEIEFMKDRLENVTEENSLISKHLPLQQQNHSNEDYNTLQKLVDDYKVEIDELKKLNDGFMNESNKRQKLQYEDSQRDMMKLLESKTEENEELLNKLNSKDIEIDGKLFEIRKLEAKIQRLETDLQTSEKPLKVLQLNNNPTSNHERSVKKSLELLMQENKDLTAIIKSSSFEANIPTVPKSVYLRLSHTVDTQQTEIKSLSKRLVRLKEFYESKSLMLNSVVYNLLGYKLEFINDYKLKLISHHDYTNVEKSSYIIVDVSKNGSLLTNNIDSGAKKGNLIVRLGVDENTEKNANEDAINVENLIKFWIFEKKQPSCFFSALNLELFDKI
ncbi:hypothetical protein CANARDRAFT_30116 [[Candida] arabinofermentans NRRL YB-2248]|uniref:Spindle assembly checkpoint component MAD1 n=1 Tax=[Candida] arabinofermentans NRRL YB-2248 TaxID=983967 RepID=A0A1E4SV09_9ASCO|nr:hypothetical protein CANARDRAFT_30116 [[Candida] arabinofermentans NRRL YB-2248]